MNVVRCSSYFGSFTVAGGHLKYVTENCNEIGSF